MLTISWYIQKKIGKCFKTNKFVPAHKTVNREAVNRFENVLLNTDCCKETTPRVEHPHKVSIENALLRLRDSLGFCPRTILDVGANHGKWSENAKKLFPNATFTLVEGNPDFESLLKSKNIGTVEIALVADVKRKVAYYKNRKSHTGNSIFRENTHQFSKDNADVVEVIEWTKTIDEISGNIPIDFMKIDVQGAELLALQGAHQTLKSVHVLTLELYSRHVDLAIQ